MTDKFGMSVKNDESVSLLLSVSEYNTDFGLGSETECGKLDLET